MKRLIFILLMFFLHACSVTQPVVGQFTKSKDDFMGEATAAISGNGTLQMRSLSGVSCTGTFKRPTSYVSGDGEFKCSDGRSGTFVFTKSNEFGGTGFGILSDGDKIRFLWGNQVSRRSRCSAGDDEYACAAY